MKQLIVNADDLGANKARNAGIFRAIEASAVTSVSILSNGPALDDAVQRVHSLQSDSISVGVHLNLSEGRPLTAGLYRLTGQDGCFLGKKAAQRLLGHAGDAALLHEIRLEIAAQILRLKGLGITISHMDGHQHVHVFPAVVTAAAEAAMEHSIPWIRIPEELADTAWDRALSGSIAEEVRFFSGHAAAARPLFQAMGASSTDNFRGLSMKGRLPAARWTEFLETIPNGLTELMVHPGMAIRGRTAEEFFDRFSTMDRERELSALIDGRFHAALAKAGIELIPFPEFRSRAARTQERHSCGF